METSPEQKLLVAIHSEEVFAGRTIRQERPACCGKPIDLYATPVKFQEVQVGLKSFTLLESRCPVCGTWVKPVYSIIH